MKVKWANSCQQNNVLQSDVESREREMREQQKTIDALCIELSMHKRKLVNALPMKKRARPSNLIGTIDPDEVEEPIVLEIRKGCKHRCKNKVTCKHKCCKR